MKREKSKGLHKRALTTLISAVFIASVAGCAAPSFSPTVVDSEWNTNYKDALSPHTQLALGVMKKIKKNEDAIGDKLALSRKWSSLARDIDSKASDATLNKSRRDIEALLGQKLVDEIKGEAYSRGDLMGFMMSSGMSIPPGGPSAMNPDLVAAEKVVAMLKGDDKSAAPAFTYKPVLPGEALSPVENLTLGTALLLERGRQSFDMSQVFRLALYFRPLRRLYDPNPNINKQLSTDKMDVETVYMDRIWRVLKPEQVAAIRAMDLTRTDMNEYLTNHVKLFKVDEKRNPKFALIEYTVNDFHEQIAPPNTIPPEEKGEFFIASSLKKLSGKDPDDGRKLFEGVCAACHGVDGQGRFPPISMKSYLSLHSDHEHYEIVRFGPPQKPGSPIVMPTFDDKLSSDQIWAVVQYLRTFEKDNKIRRGETEARAAGVNFYDTSDVYQLWGKKDGDKYFLDIQSDIAYRIMGHIPGSNHIRPAEFDQKIDSIPRDKEIIVIDMFGSQGLMPAKTLADSGYKVSYMASGMMDWHITRNYPVSYD